MPIAFLRRLASPRYRSASQSTAPTRRDFLAAAGSLVLALSLAPGLGVDAQAAPGADDGPEPDLFIRIEADGTVRIICHRSEMGQQIWTSIAHILTDELDAEWARVAIEQAEGHPRYGSQNTDGSRSIRHNFERLRIAGAAMRTMLLQAAAARWGVDASTCRTEPHAVVHPDGVGVPPAQQRSARRGAELVDVVRLPASRAARGSQCA